MNLISFLELVVFIVCTYGLIRIKQNWGFPIIVIVSIWAFWQWPEGWPYLVSGVIIAAVIERLRDKSND